MSKQSNPRMQLTKKQNTNIKIRIVRNAIFNIYFMPSFSTIANKKRIYMQNLELPEHYIN